MPVPTTKDRLPSMTKLLPNAAEYAADSLHHRYIISCGNPMARICQCY